MTLNNQYGITVSPQRILNTAQEAKAICERLIEDMENIEKGVADSPAFWSSESADLLYRLFREEKKEYEKLKNEIYAKIDRLNEIAFLYSEAENKAEDNASALPDTVIS